MALPSGPTAALGGGEGAMNLNPEAKDCYFYFYSTCSKGGSCLFRHCSAALGSEDTCLLWRDEVCRRKVCAFRHSLLDRQRSAIQCYWETQATGCLKAHCPFYHSKPHPLSPDYRDRMTNFKMSSTEVKSLDQLRSDKEMERKVEEDRKKETVEEEEEDGKKEMVGQEEDMKKKKGEEEGKRKKEMVEEGRGKKEGEGNGGGENIALDLRKELLRRMLAEQEAFRQRRAGVVGDDKQSPSSMNTVTRPAGVTPPGQPLEGIRSATGEGLAEKPYKRKVRKLEERETEKSTQKSRRKDRKSRNKTLEAPPTSHKATPASHKATPTFHDPMDFKVKTLDELKAEKRNPTISEGGPLGEVVKSRGPEVDSQQPEVKEPVEMSPGKKIILVRRRITHEAEGPESDSIPNQFGTGLRDNAKRPAGAVEVGGPESDSVPKLFGSRLKGGAKRPAGAMEGPESDSIPKQFGSRLRGSGKRAMETLSQSKRQKLDNNHEMKKRVAGHALGRPTKPKAGIRVDGVNARKRVTGSSDDGVNARKRVTGSSEYGVNARTGSSEDGVNVGVSAGHQKRKPSIDELRTEILQELEHQQVFPLASEEDIDLLHEMALYEEEGEGPGKVGGARLLSDSRNDDDLLLQMEEFM